MIRIAADLEDRPVRCRHRRCRRSQSCHAKAFDGEAHPCGGPWTPADALELARLTAFAARLLVE